MPPHRGSHWGPRTVGGVALATGLGLAASACGGSNGPAGYGAYPASLPSASTLCPTLAEVDYYVPVPASAASGVVEQSTTAGVRSTVRCVYGNPARAPLHSAVVTTVLRPSAAEARPAGVTIRRVEHVGLLMLIYRQGDRNVVVVHQGGVDVIVSSGAALAELEGFAEEELSRVPEADRA